MKNDGGEAFPCPSTGMASYNPGMSLRDWFAGMAPTEELNLPETAEQAAEVLGMEIKDYLNEAGIYWLVIVSMARFAWADAMLEAREVGDE